VRQSLTAQGSGGAAGAVQQFTVRQSRQSLTALESGARPFEAYLIEEFFHDRVQSPRPDVIRLFRGNPGAVCMLSLSLAQRYQ
jgi:hypothetical protein